MTSWERQGAHDDSLQKQSAVLVKTYCNPYYVPCVIKYQIWSKSSIFLANALFPA